jgi:hypothetical protein
VAYVEPSRRPTDGRYGENPNRLQQFHQFQVILKPAPIDIQDQYVESLVALGTEGPRPRRALHRGRLGVTHARRLGPRLAVWLDGLEVSQFTYFQQSAASTASPSAGELTYGLERIAHVPARRRLDLRRHVRATIISVRRAHPAQRVGVEHVQLRRGRHAGALRRVRHLRGRGQAPARALGRSAEEAGPARRTTSSRRRPTSSTCSTRAAPSA